MSREVRRVPLDFDWPLRTPYSGSSMPKELEPVACTGCAGRGESEIGKVLYDLWWGKVPFRPEDNGSTPHTPETPGMMDHCRRKLIDARAFYDDLHGSRGEETVLREARRLCGIWNGMWQHHLSQEDVDALLDGERNLEGLTHRFGPDGWEVIPRERPSVEEVNVWTLRLNGCGPLSMPALAIHRAAAIRRGGQLECGACGGEGWIHRDEEHRRAHDAWTPSEPPSGPGYQIWETVTSGSPVSPVFLRPEDLATWMVDETRFDDDAVGHDAWLHFVREEGFAPSGVLVNGVMVSGIMAYARNLAGA